MCHTYILISYFIECVAPGRVLNTPSIGAGFWPWLKVPVLIACCLTSPTMAEALSRLATGLSLPFTPSCLLRTTPTPG